LAPSVAERRWIGEIAHPDSAAHGLVLVCRADAAPGRADAPCAAGFLAGAVDLAMRGQDERGVVGELQIVGRHVHALGRDRLDLLEQRPGIDDDAVADDRELVRPDDAGGQQAQLVFDIADDEGVAGIVAALETHDDIGTLGQPVDDLALALVAPLRPDHRNVRHTSTLLVREPSLARQGGESIQACPVPKAIL
jgi:hypothetical protein